MRAGWILVVLVLATACVEIHVAGPRTAPPRTAQRPAAPPPQAAPLPAAPPQTVQQPAAVLPQAAPPCTAPPTGITVTRTANRTWHVCTTSPAGAVRYLLSGDRNPKPPDPRFSGAGQVRLKELWWTDARGVEHLLLLCGQCDFLTTVRLPGQPQEWSGGGHGMESEPQSLSLTLDDQELDLAVGASTTGSVLRMRQTTTGYAPAEALVSVSSQRQPVMTLDLAHEIASSGYRFRVVTEALQAHEVPLEYHVMQQGVGVCAKGIWDMIAASDGTTVSDLGGASTGCQATVKNGYVHTGSATWLEHRSSQAPVRLRTELEEGGPYRFRIVDRLADATFHIKVYGLAVPAPKTFQRGEIRTYAHRTTLELAQP